MIYLQLLLVIFYSVFTLFISSRLRKETIPAWYFGSLFLSGMLMLLYISKYSYLISIPYFGYYFYKILSSRKTDNYQNESAKILRTVLRDVAIFSFVIFIFSLLTSL